MSNYSPYTHGVTQSILGQWLNCPEMARNSLVEGLTSSRSGDALGFGNIFHELLDRFHTKTRDKHDLDLETVYALVAVLLIDMEKEYRDEALGSGAPQEELDGLDHNFGVIRVLAPEYLKYWRKETKNWQWISLEEEFCVPYVPARVWTARYTRPIYLRGKIDGRFRFKGSESHWVFETKTKGQIEDTSIIDVLPFERQVNLYAWAIKQMYGSYPTGVVYNLVRRPLLRQTKKENKREFLARICEDIKTRPDHYFVRYECYIDDNDMAKWEKDFHQMMNGFISWWEGEGPHYKNSDACAGRRYTCPFLPKCSRGEMTYLKKRTQFMPELSKELVQVEIGEQPK